MRGRNDRRFEHDAAKFRVSVETADKAELSNEDLEALIARYRQKAQVRVSSARRVTAGLLGNMGLEFTVVNRNAEDVYGVRVLVFGYDREGRTIRASGYFLDQVQARGTRRVVDTVEMPWQNLDLSEVADQTALNRVENYETWILEVGAERREE